MYANRMREITPSSGDNVEYVPEQQILGRVCTPSLLGVVAVDDEEEGKREREDAEQHFFDDIVLECPQLWIRVPARAQLSKHVPYRTGGHAWPHSPDSKH